jgi:hypothetical protein
MKVVFQMISGKETGPLRNFARSFRWLLYVAIVALRVYACLVVKLVATAADLC